jgi:hypothetical protein
MLADSNNIVDKSNYRQALGDYDLKDQSAHPSRPAAPRAIFAIPHTVTISEIPVT